MKFNADPDLSILFKDGYDICDLVWMLLLPNEGTFDEFLNLSFNCLYDIRSKLLLLLFDRLSI